LTRIGESEKVGAESRQELIAERCLQREKRYSWSPYIIQNQNADGIVCNYHLVSDTKFRYHVTRCAEPPARLKLNVDRVSLLANAETPGNAAAGTQSSDFKRIPTNGQGSAGDLFAGSIVQRDASSTAAAN
jgi:hypothetical protein